MKKLICSLFFTSQLLCNTLTENTITRASLLQTNIIPYLVEQDTAEQLESSQEQLATIEAVLATTQEELSVTTASYLDTLITLESTQDELSDANNTIDQAELLLSATAIPQASSIDTLLASLFGSAPCSIDCAQYNPNDPLNDLIIKGLIPYLQSALANIGEYNAITQIAAGGEHTVILTQNGKCYATGNNSYGQLGIGVTGGFRTTFTAIVGEGASGVTAIAAGANHTVILKGGRAYATGENSDGQLGIGNSISTNVLTPMLSPGDFGVTAIAAGTYHTVALKGDQAYATGNNVFGQLGTTSGSKYVLTLMEAPGNSGVTAITAGGLHTVALKGSQAYATGWNNSGQLGTTTGNKSILTLMQSPGDSGVTAISAGNSHTVVLKGDQAYATGSNSYGELGIGLTPTTTSILTPMLSPGNSGVTAISAGGSHTIALKGDQAYATGLNNFGQLGTTTGNKSILTSTLNSGITAIATGSIHTTVLKNNQIYSTGNNSSGQLGTTPGNKSVLTEIDSPNITLYNFNA